jgi:ElaB/YqjD/DUF883 family membrane-anchored ribosome-binding protein
MTDPKNLRDDDGKSSHGTDDALPADVTRLRGRAQQTVHDVADAVRAADEVLHDHARRATRVATTHLSVARETVHDADHDVRVRLAQGAEPIYGELEDGIDDARSVAEEALDAGRAAWSQASDAVREVSRDAMSAARETVDDIGDQCRQCAKNPCAHSPSPVRPASCSRCC